MVLLAAGCTATAGCTGAGGSGPPRDAGRPPQGSAPPIPSRGSDGGPSVRVLPVPTGGVPALPALTDAQAARLVSWPWQSIGATAGDTVPITVDVGGCHDVRGSQVRYTPAAATVAVFVTPAPAGFCTMQGMTMVTAVHLPQPLGTRELRHAPAG
jgi:hypothetical protein